MCGARGVPDHSRRGGRCDEEDGPLHAPWDVTGVGGCGRRRRTRGPGSTPLACLTLPLIRIRSGAVPRPCLEPGRGPRDITMAMTNNPFGAEANIGSKLGDLKYFRIGRLSELGIGHVEKLPFSIKVLLESCLRNTDNFEVTEEDVRTLAAWNAAKPKTVELPFKPARVILQDFTGVPAVVDLAAMRSAMKRAGGDPQKINPLVPVDLVIDHSVQVDEFGTDVSLLHNTEKEFERSRE